MPAPVTGGPPAAVEGVVESLVPARMDRLPWSRFHTRLVAALGVTWVLDGLEITIASLVGPVLQRADTLGLDSADVGRMASVYLVGEVIGALVFGHLADRLGRRRLFLWTLALYFAASALTALAFDYPTLLLFRFAAGAGIGGEYAAINSAIDELVPARYRGHTDLAVNGTYWLGALIGAAAESILLDPERLAPNVGWRIGLLVGPAIVAAIWGLRRALPESPRWLLTRGDVGEAEAMVARIEAEVEACGHRLPPVDATRTIALVATRPMGYATLARVLVRTYPERSLVSVALMASQSFLYNAIFFTYGLVLTHFYAVPASAVPHYFYAFALGNLLGPILIGRFFDTVGRKRMIAGTYVVSGMLLAATGHLFAAGVLTATTQTICWSVVFFVGSAAASSAYLTVSEIFPLEIRAQAIALFFAGAQLVGAAGPWIFAHLIGDATTPDPARLLVGYWFAAGMMIVAGLVEARFGVEAAGMSLESVATPLSAVASEDRARPGGRAP
jgi:MFS family permease